jgi:hypothetical protein
MVSVVSDGRNYANRVFTEEGIYSITADPGYYTFDVWQAGRLILRQKNVLLAEDENVRVDGKVNNIDE